MKSFLKRLTSISFRLSVFSTTTFTFCSSTVTPSSSSSKKTPVVTSDSEYIKGIKIYNAGIKEDPIPGEKRGKGVQYLNSSYWLRDLSFFICDNFDELKNILNYTYNKSLKMKGYDFIYLINQSNLLFMEAENLGLQNDESKRLFLFACWSAMAAAQCDNYYYSKYNNQMRDELREEFYKKYLNDEINMSEKEYGLEFKELRMDLIPQLALERLGIHNELCALKWSNPAEWKINGFKVSRRIDSIKRHFDAVHMKDYSEDHIAHLIWGFMAVYHVLIVFPQMNDLVNIEQIRLNNITKINQKKSVE